VSGLLQHRGRKGERFCIPSLVTHTGGNCLVTKREALEEQTPANLQKIADRLGIRVSTGLSGAFTQAVFGPVKPSRRQYIETLANSDLVTLEDIDRIHSPSSKGELNAVLLNQSGLPCSATSSCRLRISR
jgi:hypothetical protein